MFTFEQDTLDGAVRLQLTNTKTGERVTFMPEFGGNVNSLILAKGKKLYPIIQGYKKRSDFINDQQFKSWHLIPFPHRVKDGQYFFQDHVYQLPLNEADRHHARHGFYAHRHLQIESVREEADSIALRLGDKYLGEIPGYPFLFRTDITYTLHAERGFVCTTEIKNIDTNTMPLGTGWHPYFKIGGSVDELMLRLPTAYKVELDQRMLPTGMLDETPAFQDFVALRGLRLDTLFQFAPHDDGIAALELYHPQLNLRLQFGLEIGPQKYNFIYLYIPPSRDAIAVNPMTCNSDAFNSGEGLIVLASGETFRGTCGIRLA